MTLLTTNPTNQPKLGFELACYTQLLFGIGFYRDAMFYGDFAYLSLSLGPFVLLASWPAKSPTLSSQIRYKDLP